MRFTPDLTWVATRSASSGFVIPLEWRHTGDMDFAFVSKEEARMIAYASGHKRLPGYFIISNPGDFLGIGENDLEVIRSDKGETWAGRYWIRFRRRNYHNETSLPESIDLSKLIPEQEEIDWRPTGTIPEDYRAGSRDSHRVVAKLNQSTWGNVKTNVMDAVTMGWTEALFLLHSFKGRPNEILKKQKAFEEEIKQKFEKEFPDLHFDGLEVIRENRGNNQYELSWTPYAPEVDWRPTGTIPEDLYASSRNSFRIAAKYAQDKIVRTFAEAESLLEGRDKISVANNTILYRKNRNTIALRLHDTDVVTYHRDGTFTLRSGKWGTVTTQNRINRYSPVQVIRNKGVLWIPTPGLPGNRVKLTEGIKVDAHGWPLKVNMPMVTEEVDWRPTGTIPEDYYAASRSARRVAADDLRRAGRDWKLTWENAKRSIEKALSHNENEIKTLFPDFKWSLESSGEQQFGFLREVHEKFDQEFSNLVLSKASINQLPRTKELVLNMKWTPLQAPEPPDWGPPEMIPEHYYMASRHSRLARRLLLDVIN